MTVEIISWSISTKVWDWAGIKPGSAVRPYLQSDTLSTALCGLVLEAMISESNCILYQWGQYEAKYTYFALNSLTTGLFYFLEKLFQ